MLSQHVIVKGPSCIGSGVFDLNEIETLGYPIASSNKGRQKSVTFAFPVMEYQFQSDSQKSRRRSGSSSQQYKSSMEEDPILQKILQSIDDDESTHASLNFSQVNKNETEVLRQNLTKIRAMLEKAQKKKNRKKKDTKKKERS